MKRGNRKTGTLSMSADQLASWLGIPPLTYNTRNVYNGGTESLSKQNFILQGSAVYEHFSNDHPSFNKIKTSFC